MSRMIMVPLVNPGPVRKLLKPRTSRPMQVVGDTGYRVSADQLSSAQAAWPESWERHCARPETLETDLARHERGARRPRNNPLPAFVVTAARTAGPAIASMAAERVRDYAARRKARKIASQPNSPKENPMRLKLKKGSAAAKAHMAALRRLRKNPGRKVATKKRVLRGTAKGGRPVMVKGKSRRVTVFRTIGGGVAVSRGPISRKMGLVGARLNPSKRRRSIRRNPGIASAVKSAFSKQMLLAAAGTVAGFIGGRYIGKKAVELLADKVPASLLKWSGILQVALGGVVAAKSGKPLVKSIAIGVAASGIESILKAAMPDTFMQLGADGLVAVGADDLVSVGAQLPWGADNLVSVGSQLPWGDEDDGY
jgi:hypothetical protein